jgi:hypothetical protein
LWSHSWYLRNRSPNLQVGNQGLKFMFLMKICDTHFTFLHCAIRGSFGIFEALLWILRIYKYGLTVHWNFVLITSISTSNPKLNSFDTSTHIHVLFQLTLKTSILKFICDRWYSSTGDDLKNYFFGRCDFFILFCSHICFLRVTKK